MRFFLASGCEGCATSSISSSMAGTVTSSVSFTGSVMKPRSAAPLRISCNNRWDVPVMSFTSTSEWWRRYSCRRAGNTYMHTVMPPASRRVPFSTCWLSPMTVTVSLMSPNTRWLSCTSDSPAGVIRTLRPTRRKMLSFSSSSSSRIWRLIADCETRSFRPAPVKEPVSATAWTISS